MASTYTDLGLELMATGENAGTWGTKTNANLNLVEQISGGYAIQTLNAAGTGANTTTLAKADGALNATVASRVIILGAVSAQAITGNKIVTLPVLTENFYLIKNSTSGAYTVQLKAASGSGATVTWATTDKGWKILYADGVATNTGVYDIGMGDVTLAGTQTLTNKTLTDAVAITNSVTGEIVPGKVAGTNFTGSLLVGHETTGTLSSANYNTGVGTESLDAITGGTNNTMLGYRTGTSITSGSNNTVVGTNAGRTIGTGLHNTVMGENAGAVILNGNHNILLGQNAGDVITSGNGNVMIGNNTDPAANNSVRELKITGYDGATTTTWISGDSSGNVTVAGTLTSTTGLVKTVGLETMWVPASAMYASTTNGADAEQIETTAERPDMKVFDFDASTRQMTQFSVAFPKSWTEGTITYQCFWTPSTTNTGNCLFRLSGVSVGDGDTIDVAFGTEVEITDAGIGTVEDQQVSAVSSAVTIAGSPAVDQQTYFQLFRDANAGGDTFSADARVLGLKIFFTTDAANDA
jgi:hypothetical protein